MNKIKKTVPVAILLILSVVILFIVNNNYGNLNHKAGPSQVESTTLSDNSDSENNIYTKIDWLNDYTMPCDITGDSVLCFEEDKLIFLSSVRIHGQPEYAPESTKLKYTEISHIHNNKEISEDIKYDISQNYDYISTRNKIFTADIKNIMVNDYYTEDSTGYDTFNIYLRSIIFALLPILWQLMR